MLASFLTATCFAISVTSASVSSRLLGSATANFARMLVALAALTAYAFSFGQGMGGGALRYFILSGALGFGLGDVALYLALPRIGPRLTILLAQCLAAPFAAVIEWFWLGTTMTAREILWGAMILTGVAVALSPSGHVAVNRRDLRLGALFGTLAGLGQAMGAVTSRRAYEAAFEPIDGGTAALQRMLGGIGIAAIFFLIVKVSEIRRAQTADTAKQQIGTAERWKQASGWVVLNALSGPAVGVGCYQWALSTSPSAVVLPIVALAPVVIIPVAHWVEGDRPSRRSVAGALIAVTGAIALAMG